MYIQPNSTLRLLSGVPLEASYINTLWWTTKEEQRQYFESKAVRTFNQLTYQRYNEGTLSIEGKADLYYNVNYCMFQNTSYGDKWFYAFVTDVTYVNDNMTQVSYSLDVMQTWFFDYSLFDCFVEREHSVTDNIGENLLAENLETGDYKIYETEYVIAPFYKYDANHLSDTTSARWVLFASEPVPNTTGEYEPIKNGVYSGLYRYDGLNLALLVSMINSYNNAGKQEAIVSVAQYPSFFDTDSPQSRYYTSTKQNFSNLDGYVPRNKKLFTHPFHLVTLVSSDGGANTLKYEYFNNLTPRFYIEGITNPMPEAFCFPINYNGDASNLLEGLFVKNFPTVPIVSDVFKAWYAQNKNSIDATLTNTIESSNLGATQARNRAILGGIGNIAQGAMGVIGSLGGGGIATLLGIGGIGAHQLMKGKHMANPEPYVGGISSAIGSAVDAGLGLAGNVQSAVQARNSANQQIENAQRSALATQRDHQAVPNGVIGHAGSAGTIYSLNACGFRLYHSGIRAQYARMIDNYFDRYGYATNRVKQPNRNSRPHWNYVRTVGCVINGNMPTDHEEAIQQIYDSGITFWKNPSEVNDYTLDNRPT